MAPYVLRRLTLLRPELSHDEKWASSLRGQASVTWDTKRGWSATFNPWDALKKPKNFRIREEFQRRSINFADSSGCIFFFFFRIVKISFGIFRCEYTYLEKKAKPFALTFFQPPPCLFSLQCSRSVSFYQPYNCQLQCNILLFSS